MSIREIVIDFKTISLSDPVSRISEIDQVPTGTRHEDQQKNHYKIALLNGMLLKFHQS